MRTFRFLALMVCLAAVPMFVGCGGVSMESSSVTPTDTGDDGTEDEADSRPSNDEE
jgi:hypothetical protein